MCVSSITSTCLLGTNKRQEFWVRASCFPVVIGVPIRATGANLCGLFSPSVVDVACFPQSQLCQYQTHWIPPSNCQRQSRCSKVFLVSAHGELRKLTTYAPAPALSRFCMVGATIRLASLISESIPLGLELIHRGHQQNFGQTEVAQRVLRDLEHNHRCRA